MSCVKIISFNPQPSGQNNIELSRWPFNTWQYETNANNVCVGFSSGSQSKSTDASLFFKCNKNIDYHIMQVHAELFKILSRKLRRSKHVFKKKCIKANDFVGLTSKALLLIELSSFVPSPIYVIMCNNSANFFCGNVIKTIFRRIADAKRNEMWQIVNNTFDIDETFEFQFNDTFSIKSEPQNDSSEDNATTDSTNEFSLVPQQYVELFAQNERQQEYKKFLDQEYKSTVEYDPNSFRYFQSKLIKNKLTIHDLTAASSNFVSLNKLLKRNPALFPPDISKVIKNANQYFKDKAKEYKCCVCTTAWQDSMLSECYHMNMCRNCAMRNRVLEKRYTCPICNKISQFIINDLDL